MVRFGTNRRLSEGLKKRSNISSFRILVALFLMAAFSSHALSQGFVLIRSNPSGARLEVQNQAGNSTTPFQQLLEAGNYNFSITHEKYYSYNGTFKIENDKTTIIDAVLTPKFGNLKLLSEPAGALVYIDGSPTSLYTPAMISELSSGVHKIRLSLPMYLDASDTVTVFDNRLTERFFELAAGFGTIGINTDDSTSIFLDGEWVANNNYFGRLKEGSYSFTFKKEKHYTQKQEISLVRGEEIKMDIIMQPITGTISVICDPPETDISLDGKHIGQSPMVIKGVFTGQHDIGLSRKGYRPIVKTVNVTEDQVILINESLIEGGVKPTFATNPSGASLFINDLFIGVTPFTKVLKPGQYQIRFEKEGYITQNEEIYLHTNTDFTFDLDKAFQEVSAEIYPQDVKIFCDGTLVIPDNKKHLILEEGEHSLVFKKEKHITDSLRIKVFPEMGEVKFILYPEKYRKKMPALMLSLLFPGAGQSYLSRGEKSSYLWSFVGYGLLGGAYAGHKAAQKARDEAYENENDPAHNNLLNDAEKYEEYSMYMLYGAGAVWGMNFTVTLFSRSEKRKFNRMQVKLGIDPFTGSTQAGLDLKF